ncbi:MAG: extracellular solute-binding protein [Chloroflexi bacterium]|nr:extracellular solute-binding protein [Chloroflexota bacterium]
MKLLAGCLVVSCSLWLISIGCALQSPAGPETKPSVTVAAGKARAPWEDKWEETLSRARKEGAVSVYSGWAPIHRTVLTRAFTEKYGIPLEFTPYSRGSDLLAKVQAESRAGLQLVDVFGGGNTTLIVTLKPAGAMGPVKPLLILPEVLDPKVWRGDKVPYADEEGFSVSMIGYVVPSIAYNSEQIREGELTSLKDLLKPAYKGRITLNDPSVTGAANAILSHLSLNVWGESDTASFLKRLIVEQGAFVQRDNRVQVESVARGKYSIALGTQDTALAEFLASGAPLRRAILAEDNRLATGSGAVGVSARPANPSATTVFVNWLLTREGQTLFAQSFGAPSARTDVSTEGYDPLLIPAPGKKYHLDSPQLLAARDTWLQLSRKVMDEIKK